MHSFPVSLTFVWNKTLFPSFHISVTSVSPGVTVPAKRTLMFLYLPNLCFLCVNIFPEPQQPKGKRTTHFS